MFNNKNKGIRIIQNSVVLKLKYDTLSSILNHKALNKLKLLIVLNQIFELSERYVRAGDFESRYIEYLTSLFTFLKFYFYFAF
ncbi:hypothetical protein BpHYR1_029073 [Brachionus plicatilis]|uniref:Uncharacterized protein n=1 Tax=Brachionus plicatilis TaxID=10195 RepID=A0A3M7PKI0_BRAPC|nr:hypothetical protein BpHYR1_029073 [Brachionus plicatilis]